MPDFKVELKGKADKKDVSWTGKKMSFKDHTDAVAWGVKQGEHWNWKALKVVATPYEKPS